MQQTQRVERAEWAEQQDEDEARRFFNKQKHWVYDVYISGQSVIFIVNVEKPYYLLIQDKNSGICINERKTKKWINNDTKV